jgi:hypothetical protein
MTRVQTSPKLAAMLDARIAERGYLTITSFARAAGVTAQGLQPLRRGEIRDYQPRLTAPVCKLLGWTPDSIARMMAGEDPVELEPVSAGGAADVAAAVEELRRTTEALAARLDELERGDPPPSAATGPLGLSAHSARPL